MGVEPGWDEVSDATLLVVARRQPAAFGSVDAREIGPRSRLVSSASGVWAAVRSASWTPTLRC